MGYRRNPYRQEVINRYGQTAGLPLFERTSKAIPEPTKSRFKCAPKTIAVATDTKKLGHIAATHDPVRLGDKQQKVLDAFRAIGPASNTEVAHHLGWPINQVVGRTFELRELGLVVPAIKRVCSITGFVVQTWRCV